MALLRECLQELRTKHHEWDVPAGGWPPSRPMLQQPLRKLSPLAVEIFCWFRPWALETKRPPRVEKKATMRPSGEQAG